MLKNILNLDGAQQLSKNEQKEINGGIPVPSGSCATTICGDGYVCKMIGRSPFCILVDIVDEF